MSTAIRTRLLLLLLMGTATLSRTQVLSVTAKIEVRASRAQNESSSGNSQAVVWLTPLASNTAPIVPGHFRLGQKDKRFHPHLLVVPIGSTVAFPNLDPFFHNVFSLFNGKRFDLGLYEAGTTRDVYFNHEGVSFIFCNIHPEMSAVIVTLATPYFGVSGTDGRVEIRDVPAGSYELQVWTESADAVQIKALARVVDIGPLHQDLGVIRITRDAEEAPHKNKFGRDYSRSNSTVY